MFLNILLATQRLRQDATCFVGAWGCLGQMFLEYTTVRVHMFDMQQTRTDAQGRTKD